MNESRADKTVNEPRFMFVERHDPKLMEAIRLAQTSLPSFRKLIQTNSRDRVCLVKSYFTEGAGFWLWLVVKEAREHEFVGEIFEAPPEIPELKVGSAFIVADSELADWMIIENGVLYGGYSLRLQRRRTSEEKRAEFDKYVGVQSYAPLPR